MREASRGRRVEGTAEAVSQRPTNAAARTADAPSDGAAAASPACEAPRQHGASASPNSCGADSSASALSDFDEDEDDCTMSDAESMDPGLSATLSGLQVCFARRSAEVEALKAALEAAERTCTAATSATSTPRHHQARMPGGAFVWLPDGRLASISAPDAGTQQLTKELGSSAPTSGDCDDTCFRTRSLPEAESQLLAELAVRNGVPVRCF